MSDQKKRFQSIDDYLCDIAFRMFSERHRNFDFDFLSNVELSPQMIRVLIAIFYLHEKSFRKRETAFDLEISGKSLTKILMRFDVLSLEKKPQLNPEVKKVVVKFSANSKKVYRERTELIQKQVLHCVDDSYTEGRKSQTFLISQKLWDYYHYLAKLS